jgi:hypothetical protein
MGGGMIYYIFLFVLFLSYDKVLELNFIFHISIVLYQTPTHNFLTLTNSSNYQTSWATASISLSQML